eukprot:CAMPEP_0183291000 /NCGR_PEP_ID=MMETSP0160_2-20130417/561_1 /TAXON_ID=2839 ORGANISM="Odontella Sinensis, Strain Grunow 1884" /NCGR_SAMPLE_ID=MMETSP0160_2 /ASSEMBLY_ACC=CAM_ASM_000250 /LENGTH=199 /DNA_ID=CAMNT_0025451739 /DNA_START=46 /DNA_END=645 /DNA_ORIENTATION=+
MIEADRMSNKDEEEERVKFKGRCPPFPLESCKAHPKSLRKRYAFVCGTAFVLILGVILAFVDGYMAVEQRTVVKLRDKQSSDTVSLIGSQSMRLNGIGSNSPKKELSQRQLHELPDEEDEEAGLDLPGGGYEEVGFDFPEEEYEEVGSMSSSMNNRRRRLDGAGYQKRRQMTRRRIRQNPNQGGDKAKEFHLAQVFGPR